MAAVARDIAAAVGIGAVGETAVAVAADIVTDIDGRCNYHIHPHHIESNHSRHVVHRTAHIAGMHSPA